MSLNEINELFEDDLFEVGDDKIDSQHRQLFELIKSAKEKAFDDASSLLEKLKNYTEVHFSREEQFMEDHGYPLLEDHKGFHKDLLDKLSLIASSSLASDDQKEEVLELVQHWLKVHIFVHDKAYAQFFKEHTS